MFNGWTDVEIAIDYWNLQLNAIYYCATSGHTYGKGNTIKEAKSLAGIHTKADEKRHQFYVMAAILNNPTKEELENMRAYITANQMSGSPEYYKDNRTAEDTAMINKLHVGWLTVEKNY